MAKRPHLGVPVALECVDTDLSSAVGDVGVKDLRQEVPYTMVTVRSLFLVYLWAASEGTRSPRQACI